MGQCHVVGPMRVVASREVRLVLRAAAGLVPRAYDDTPPAVWPIALISLDAHLRKLEQDGRVTRDGERWQPFQLRFGFAPSWSYPYAVVARRMFHAPWLSQGQPGAPHAFFVGPRDAATALPSSPDRLELETIYVEGR